MRSSTFTFEIDGRRVVVDQSTQEVSILDERGAVVFRDRIQVAAGSVQGLFDTVSIGLTRAIEGIPGLQPIGPTPD